MTSNIQHSGITCCRKLIGTIVDNKIRWQGQGRIDKQEYSLMYSGPKRGTGLYGTGFMVSKRVRNSILEFEAINERFCKLHL
jgi:hypothetical protein